ncbi:hypothetical protein [Methanobrevibacter sp. UBA212]|uniref:hypothetical protein n=1 Tax=Methanobrevibacter sp. UBA212 TaxID=1915476 RepID=UPI0025D38DD7|nr:hypothetical protein [Methanobrevibacter sp. UBA212]
MLFNTIEEYNNDLNDIESRLHSMEERMKQYPERKGIAINYNSFKQLHDIILKDREDYVKMLGENTKVHFNNGVKHDFSLQSMSEIFGGVNDLTFSLADILKSAKGLKSDHIPSVRKVSSGSLHLTFSMGDEKTDLREVQLNYDIFNTLFDVFECGEEDIPKLNDKLGGKFISSYQNFLNILIKHKLDITLENSARNVTLTHEDALKVYNILSH